MLSSIRRKFLAIRYLVGRVRASRRELRGSANIGGFQAQIHGKAIAVLCLVPAATYSYNHISKSVNLFKRGV